jgi:hypothetical protein
MGDDCKERHRIDKIVFVLYTLLARGGDSVRAMASCLSYKKQQGFHRPAIGMYRPGGSRTSTALRGWCGIKWEGVSLFWGVFGADSVCPGSWILQKVGRG